ncbi:MAG: hypothetical protein WAO55_15300 [Candidatus Manganitrophaceae bacterium]
MKAMIRRFDVRHRVSISVFLLTWFFVWGICPWENPSATAQPLRAVHVGHGHREGDDTHHASKGSEHGCTGSISYTKKSEDSRYPLHAVAPLISLLAVASPPIGFDRHPYFFESTFLPKQLTEYYQLYSVYRI